MVNKDAYILVSQIVLRNKKSAKFKV